MLIRYGITRSTLLTHNWAFKVPVGVGVRFNNRLWNLVRGWLANRSEWHQRERADVNPPIFTLFHLLTVYRRADTHPDPLWWSRAIQPRLESIGYSSEEAKSSSWGLRDGRWVLTDYDRSWEEPRGLIGSVYYRHENHLSVATTSPESLVEG